VAAPEPPPSCKGEELYRQALALLPAPGRRGDAAQALDLLQKAGTLGWAAAETKLGEIYLQGRMVKEDLAAAVRWFQSAAGKGDPEAQTQLGSLYQCGLGVPLDLKEAGRWLKLAADQGSAEARKLLDQMLSSS